MAPSKIAFIRTSKSRGTAEKRGRKKSIIRFNTKRVSPLQIVISGVCMCTTTFAIHQIPWDEYNSHLMIHKLELHFLLCHCHWLLEWKNGFYLLYRCRFFQNSLNRSFLICATMYMRSVTTRCNVYEQPGIIVRGSNGAAQSGINITTENVMPKRNFCFINPKCALVILCCVKVFLSPKASPSATYWNAIKTVIFKCIEHLCSHR